MEYVGPLTYQATRSVLGGLFLVNKTLETNLSNFGAGGQTVIYFVIIGCAGLNFIAEFIVNLVVSPAINTVVNTVKKHIKHYRGKNEQNYRNRCGRKYYKNCGI